MTIDMDALVEAGAKALMLSEGYAPEDWNKASQFGRDHLFEQARAVIAAALPMLLVDVERAHSSAQYDPAPYTKGKAAIRARFDELAKEIGGSNEQA